MCETCGEKTKFERSFSRKDLWIRQYRCENGHKTRVFVKGLPRKHDPEAHLRQIKAIIAGRSIA